MGRLAIGIVIGPSGRGSNMAAIIRACEEGRIKGDVRVVVSPKTDTEAVKTATGMGVSIAICDPGSEHYAGELAKALDGCNLICLAGYLRLLPIEILRAFPGRVLNIHPALLPKFGGKGMYGRRVHEAVLEAREKETGCTVHLVTEHYDEGRILIQRQCPVLPDDSAETLANRVLKEEHAAYVQAINQFEQ